MVIKGASLVVQVVKNAPAMQETWVLSLVWEDPLKKSVATHSIFLPGVSHGQRSLAGYSPCYHKESDLTEQLSTAQQGIIQSTFLEYKQDRHELDSMFLSSSAFCIKLTK